MSIIIRVNIIFIGGLLMKNKIIYGIAGSGKTENYFNSKIENWEEKIIAISFNNMEIEGFKTFHLGNPNLVLDEIFLYDKVLLLGELKANPYWDNAGIKNVITYLIENISNFESKLLLAIDDFSHYNLSEKYNNKSLMLNLLELENVYTFFVLQDLKQIKKIYKDDYKEIIELSNVICTKDYQDYSGELRVRFPKSLHRDLKETADKEGISLNQYIVYLLTKTLEKENREEKFIKERNIQEIYEDKG
uniref:toxin-antitoxin system HicB family antitoxin n=1 Tax=Clostridium botulinum TaxID=1491 RepID=UPI001F287D72|nr:toxin-antitoxin system HicB family antitoxin [Clostridium botulinum]